MTDSLKETPVPETVPATIAIAAFGFACYEFNRASQQQRAVWVSQCGKVVVGNLTQPVQPGGVWPDLTAPHDHDTGKDSEWHWERNPLPQFYERMNAWFDIPPDRILEVDPETAYFSPFGRLDSASFS